MHFLHGRIVQQGIVQAQKASIFRTTGGAGTGSALANGQKRKEMNMAQPVISRHATGASLGEGLGGFINAAMQRLAQHRAYRRTIHELSELSAHDLADLGLNRSEIRRVAYESVYGTRR